MTEIQTAGGIRCRLIRSNRRTLAIAVQPDGEAVARAPMGMPENEIEAFLNQKEAWIAAKQAQARANAPVAFALADGAELPWLGATLRLRMCGVPMCIDFDGALLTPNQGDAAAHIRAWRRQRACEVLGGRVRYWAAKTGLEPASVAYTAAKRRWGSMSRDRALRLNAALLHCPMELCDYVIVHELAHMAHANHSPAFHALVREILPGADALRARMRGYGAMTGLF
ncbi:MAG: SprT family zinc-dependent metalloprotease [Eubacteriales bacterium]|nr:SprT family zinc-dependent metalloprotease [Eubacteriales bacterium]